MSIFGKAFKFAKKALRRVAPLILGGAIGGAAEQVVFSGPRATPTGAVPRRFQQLPTVIPGVGRISKLPTLAQTFDINGMPRKKRRRINPANTRALTRAVRRINASLNLLKKVEKLQKRVHPAPRRRAPPPGHVAKLTHQ